MRSKLFGTDGIRGQANIEPLTPGTVSEIAMAVAQQFHSTNRHNLVVIGKDTRLSCYMVESALVAGFVAAGQDVILLGPLPTPAVAMLTRSLRADLGVMISASHNPYQDNGLKFFGPQGYKISDEFEQKIEEGMQKAAFKSVRPQDMGKVTRLEDAPGRYIEFVKNTFPKGLRLEGIKVVIDAAQGAAYKVAPRIFWELGAEIIVIGDSPNGCNINDQCGATHPQIVQQAVIDHNADVGIALDGDSDRLVMVDEKGNIIDGDQLIALISTFWHMQGSLKGGGIVTTVMSNLGLERYIESLGLKMVRTPVGDRHVTERMAKDNYNVGGEQSGHIILNDYTTTGDGLIAALQVLALIVPSKKPVSDFSRIFTPVPQVMEKIYVKDPGILNRPDVQNFLQQIHLEIAGYARLLVRKSGTEKVNSLSVIRIMAEGDRQEDLKSIINKVTQYLQDADQAQAA